MKKDYLRRLAASAFLAAAFLCAGAEPWTYAITQNHADALYRCGEETVFSVTVKGTNGSPVRAGKVSATMDNFGGKRIGTQVFDLAAANPFTMKGSLDAPGFLRLRVRDAADPASRETHWGVGYEPERIEKGSPLPDDFDLFWAEAKRKLAAEVPADIQLDPVPERSTAAFDFYRLSAATFGRRVYGYLSVPKDRAKGPFRVNIQVSAAGFGGWTNNMGGSPDTVQAFFAVYPFAPDWRWEKLGLKAKYDALNAEMKKKYGTGYSTAGMAVSREEYFFYPVLLGIDRVVDWIAAQPYSDLRRFHYAGTSQGGGFGFYLCGLNRHFTRACFFVPAITDTLGYLKGRQSGWPRFDASYQGAARAAAEKNMPYFDGANFATRITCPVRVAVGFADTTCAPCAVYAAYNAIRVRDKAIEHGIGMGHGCRGEIYGKLNAWLNDERPGPVPCAAEPALKDVKLGGAAGAKMARLFEERIFGAEAKGKIYDETVKAFRTHWDDCHPDVEWMRKEMGLWQGEYWGKTMLSAAVVCDYARDAELKTWLKDRAGAFVREFQQPDGYLCTYKDRYFLGGPKPGGGEVFCWNLWGRKYTMWALIELARVTETPDLLEAAAKIMDQEIAQLTEKGQGLENTGFFVGLPSMSVLKPLLLLHRATGKWEYRAFARKIVAAWDRAGNPAPNLLANARGDALVHTWYRNPSGWAKAYEMMSCLEGLIAYAQLEERPEILAAVQRLVDKLVQGELNAVDGVGFFDHFTHAAACANALTEPCDVTHWIRVLRELFRATDDAKYLDLLEKAYLNAFLAGVYRDGRWGAHAVRAHGTRHRTAPHQVGMAYHQCCIDNMPRTFMDVAQSVVSRAPDGALSVNLYSDATAKLDGESVAITGGYPLSDAVDVRVDSAAGGRVRFRVPTCFDALTVDGVRAAGPWHTVSVPVGGKTFALRFARTPRCMPVAVCEPDPRARAYETADETPEMKGRARTRPGVRVYYGPVLLAKGLYAGTAEEDIFRDLLTSGEWRLTIEPRARVKTDGAWKLRLVKDGACVTLDVGDFASIADADDPANRFSIWF